MKLSFIPKFGRVALASTLLLATTLTPSQACTGLRLTNKDGTTVSGRTVEFGIEIEGHAAMIPRGQTFTGQTPAGDGMKYTAKHAVVGLYAYTDVKIMDGLNDAGLMAGAFYLPQFSTYTPVTAENQSKGVSSAEFPNWILTQFGSVDEVRKAVEAGDVVITPTVLNGWGNEPPPFHYAVYDKSGAAIVIEAIDGKLVIHDNPLGVVTNSPTFDWHMTNLRNYITVQPNNVNSGKIGPLELKAFGQGNGMWGIPGDFSPPSRFVRAALFSANAIPSDNAEEGIPHIFHVLNNFDIPKGIGRAVDSTGAVSSDYSQFTVARDAFNLRYYYRSYKDQSIHMIDMKKLDLDAKEIKSFPIDSDQPITDMSAQLK